MRELAFSPRDSSQAAPFPAAKLLDPRDISFYIQAAVANYCANRNVLPGNRQMINKTISHYKILEKLGEGGMGVVFKAEDTKLKRTVALKFLPAELTRDAEAKARFIREAQAAAALHHPDICTIYEIDEAENQTFISMAYIDGESLKDRIERGPLKLEETLDIAVHVAQGLQAAHEKGIIHRDVKSANVMLARSGQVNVMDFGLAKLSGRTMVTREGTTLGTAGYMSPEQALGEDVDNRSDIWSLGVVLYEMLTGLLPFRGEYEQGLIYQIINAAPEPITSLRTGVPMELERIVSKCLEKNRDERYQTPADLIADLRHVQKMLSTGTQPGERATAARTATSNVEATGSARRWRWWYWAAPLIVVAIVVTALFLVKTKLPHRVMFQKGRSSPHEKSIAVLPFVDMSPEEDQEYFCDGMTEELINRLSNIQTLRVPARTSVFLLKGKGIQEVGSKLNVQTVLEGSVRKADDQLRITAQLINVADGYHLWSETYDRKLEDVFAIQDEISSAIVNALKLKLTPQEQQRLSEHPIDNVKAYDCYLKANRQIMRFDEKSVDSALVYLRAAIDIMGDNAELYAGMAMAYGQYANIGLETVENSKRAEEYARKAISLDPDSPGALVELASESWYGNYPQNYYDAFRYLKKALTANPSGTKALSDMAFYYMDIGRPSQALAFAQTLENQDPLNPRWLVLRGLCFQYNCQYGPALEEFRKYYQADSTNAFAQLNYATTLAYVGKRDEALSIIGRATTGNHRNVAIVFCLQLKYALLNDRGNALRLITPDFRQTCWRDMEWSYYVASRLSLAGAKKEALDWLENSINRGFINYPLFQCDPFLDNIRGEERFKKLMERAKYEWEHFEVPE